MIVHANACRSNPEEAELSDTLVGWLENFVGVDEEPNEPASDLLFPIVNDLTAVDASMTVDGVPIVSNRTTVAGIRSPFYWRNAIQDILPKDSNGVVLVFDSKCTIPFTYQINGPSVVYLGRGDLHDTKYDHMEMNSLLFDLKSHAIEKSKYTGPEIDSSYCPMLLRVYPSDTMANDYLTSNPFIFTAVSVLIFLFTSLIFIAYDFKVERRQNVVMQSAVKSNAIVSSLLPSHIRDKLMSDAPTETQPAKEAGNKKQVDATDDEAVPADAAYGIRSFLDGDGLPSTCVDKYEESDALRFPEPIADQYEETSVLAASVSGFTIWSINRDPKHIFILLEVLHGSFDAIAKQLKILKVDAMKDCYCAVSGIPDYRKNHALIMTKFAMTIMSKMSVLTQRLIVTLGREAASLKLSIGISSGATTAGVLRSAKTRFQLFGNTVASAELLDRTGIPGRIQCSQKTANLLIEAGKGNLLARRDDQAHHMETYWIANNASRSSVGNSTGNNSAQLSGDSENAGSFNASIQTLALNPIVAGSPRVPVPPESPRGRPHIPSRPNSTPIDDTRVCSLQQHSRQLSNGNLAHSIDRSTNSHRGSDVREQTRSLSPQRKSTFRPEVTRPVVPMDHNMSDSGRSTTRRLETGRVPINLSDSGRSATGRLDTGRVPINLSGRHEPNASHPRHQSLPTNRNDIDDARTSLSHSNGRGNQSAFGPSERFVGNAQDDIHYRSHSHAQPPITGFRPVSRPSNFDRAIIQPRPQPSEDYLPPENDRPGGISSREHSRKNLKVDYREPQRYYGNVVGGGGVNYVEENDFGYGNYSGHRSRGDTNNSNDFRRFSGNGEVQQGYENTRRRNNEYEETPSYNNGHQHRPGANMHYVNDNLREWIHGDVHRNNSR
jgi:class 3 adenylate cyclase